VMQQVNKEPPVLRSYNLSISPMLEAVVLRTLAKRREDRPRSAEALARELATAVNSTATDPFAVHQPESLPKQPVEPGPRLAPTMVLNTPLSGAAQVLPPTGGQMATAFPARKQRSKAVFIGIALGGLLLVAGLIAIYLAFFSFSARRVILDEIARGNLVTPEGSSAYDLYVKHKAQDLTAPDKDEIMRNVQSKLEKKGDQIFANLKQEQSETETEWKEAERIYAWLNELSPRPVFESKVFFAQASNAFAKKDYKNAISLYQRASKLQPNWSLALNRIGRAYLNLNDRRNGREYYRQATVAEPDWIMPWLNLGQTCLLMGDPYTAEPAFRKAISIDTTKPQAHYGLAQTLESLGRGCEALGEYTTTQQLITDNPAKTVKFEDVRKRIDYINTWMFCE
jgi:tetratricopeptide (TPR) repeat protein